MMCGPKLWKKIEPQAERNGLRPAVSLVSTTSDLRSGKSEVQQLAEKPLVTADEVRLFIKTLQEVFSISAPASIRRANRTELSSLSYQQHDLYNDLETGLFGSSIGFIVEVNRSRFIVLVESEPEVDMKTWSPVVRWIELMDR